MKIYNLPLLIISIVASMFLFQPFTVAEEKIKGGYDNVTDETHLKQFVYSGMKTKLWTAWLAPNMHLKIDNMGRMTGQMDTEKRVTYESFAKLAGQYGIDLYMTVGFFEPYVKQLESLGSYSHAVVQGPTRYESLGEKPAPSPLEERYWLGQLLAEAKFVAELSKKYPSVKGFLVDFEMYAGKIMWHYNSSFDDQTFNLVTKEMIRRGKMSQSIKPEAAPRDQRYQWLKDHKLLEIYFSVQEDLVAAMAENFRKIIHEINPDLKLGFLPYQANWFYNAWARGLGTKSQPVLIFSESEYEGWSPSMLTRIDYLKDQGISFRYVPGLLMGNFTPGQLTIQAKRCLETADGYWLFTTYSLWEKEPKNSWVPYSIKAPKDQYWLSLSKVNDPGFLLPGIRQFDRYLPPEGSKLLTGNRHYSGPGITIPVRVKYNVPPYVPFYSDPKKVKLFDGGEGNAYDTVAWFAQKGKDLIVTVDLSCPMNLDRVYLVAGHELENAPAVSEGVIEVASSLDNVQYYPLGVQQIPGNTNMDYRDLGLNARYLKITFKATKIPTDGVWAFSELAVWGNK